MKRIFTLFFLLPNLFLNIFLTRENTGFLVLGQGNIDFPTTKSQISPLPQAATLTKYGDYPVSHNTGLVDMKVPIYNIKSGNLSLPVSISFHASGRMANEANGILGIRWVINAGGVITRTVHGYPDEWNYLTPYTVNPNHTPDYDELRRSCEQGFIAWEGYNPNSTRTDSELDVFKYILPNGKSGQFVLKNENGEFKAIQIPYEALKIELVKDSNPSQNYFASIAITDVDGTVYKYGNTTLNSGYTETGRRASDEAANGGKEPVAWYLKSIVSSDKKDSIEFSYQNGNFPAASYSETITVGDKVRDESVNANFHQNDAFGPALFYKLRFEPIEEPVSVTKWDAGGNAPVINSIQFKDGELNFTYSEYSNATNTILQKITLSGAINRRFKFNQTQALTENLNYLKSLEILSLSGNVEKLEEKYTFDYYEPSTPIIDSANPGNYPREKKDWWGFYKSGYYTPGTTHLIPFKTISLSVMDNGNTFSIDRNIGSNNDRDPDLESMKLGMLKSITYPTGGTTVFEYENNHTEEFNAPTQTFYTKIGPGLRIKKVINKPLLGKEMIKFYKYGKSENGGGYLNSALKAGANTVQEVSTMIYWDYYTCFGLDCNSKIYFNEQAGCRIKDYSSDPFINSADFGGNIVWYDIVTEYSEEDQTSYSGEYYNNAINGKIIYEYSRKEFDTKNFVVNDPQNQYNDNLKVFSNPYKLWQGGKLISKTTYKNQNGIFKPVTSETYTYKNTDFEELWDMPVYNHVLMSNIKTEPDNSFTLSWYNTQKNYHNNTCAIYGYGFRKYLSGSEKIDSKTIKYYDGNGIASTTEYFYDPLYDRLKKEVLTKSDGKKNSIQYEYSFDKTTLPLSDMTNVYNKMVEKNIITTPVSQSQYIINGSNNVFLQSKRTEFSEPLADIIRPKTEYFKKGSGPEEIIITYDKYNENGNPEEISQADGMPVVYVWGYNKTQPIAKIENATYTTGKPHTITASQQTLINDAVTASINETTALTESTLIAKLQLLRNGFPNGMVTTYTYDPLIGITSMTDPKNYTTYYKYDGFGRLKTVMDNEGKILSSNNYNYKNP